MKRFTTPDGLSLAYDDAGSGLPIVCLPGLTRNAADFDDLAAALKGRHRLIRLTLRGRGASDFDPDPTKYSVETETGDVIAFLDHLGLDRVVVVGTSRGGIIAMVLGAVAKDRLAGVVLNDIGPEVAPEGIARIMTYLGVTPGARDFEALAGALKATMGDQFPDLPAERWHVLARRWFAEGPDGRPVLDYDPRLRDGFEALPEDGAPPIWPLFDALEGVPLAALRGENSDLLTRETFVAMQARRPDMIAVEVPRRGHVPFLDEPESIAALEALIAKVRT